MTLATACLAVLRFACWETALFAASIVLARALGWGGARRVEEKILAVLGIEIVLESSFGALFSFTRTNSPAVYWIAAALCLLGAAATRGGREALARAAGGLKTAEILRYPRAAACGAGFLAPLVLLSFHPVQESDSINYLHYLIDWMANRATPYSFATNYVAFWELSFLPSWTVTGLDVFFPLLALKAVVLLALAVWLAGRELGLRRHLLLGTVFGVILLRYLWWEPSGVPTLKNDVLHGAGFVLVTLVVLRAARRRLRGADAALFALGAAFVAVKYTGVFVAALAAAAVLFLEWRRAKRRAESGSEGAPSASGRGLAVAALASALFVLLTSGHYYLHSLLLYGSPFYPFQINFAFLHLPGTADLSGTSILYNLRNPGLWRALFLPASGISSAGLLFPLVLAATPAAGAWLVARRPPASGPLPWAGFLLLAGWFLYFRSVYGAGAAPGDLGFIVGLSSLRYVIGVLAVSELLLMALLRRFPPLALALVGLNAASRAAILYAKLPLDIFPVPAVVAVSAAAGLAAWLVVRYTPQRRRALAAGLAAGVALVACGPPIVERNRSNWLSWWDGLKPALAVTRTGSLAVLVYPEWGYFAGHILAAGNPVHPAVRALAAEDLDALPAAGRPRYLAAMLMPGSAESSTWRTRRAAEFERWGYSIAGDSGLGAILEQTLPPIPAAADTSLDAWYAPAGTVAIAGVPEFSGHTLRIGDIVADTSGGLARLDPNGRQPLEPAPGAVIRLRNCGEVDFARCFPPGRPPGAIYRREAGRWIPVGAPPKAQAALPSPSWYASIAGGHFVQEVLTGEDAPFIRLRAANDARWLIYSAAYPDGLPDGVPVTVRAVVRCPNGCSLSTAGHTPELDRPVRSDDWTTVNLSFEFQRNGRPQHYAVGMAACHRGDWFDLRSFDLRAGVFPYD
jgi:hypothetical protein